MEFKAVVACGDNVGGSCTGMVGATLPAALLAGGGCDGVKEVGVGVAGWFGGGRG